MSSAPDNPLRNKALLCALRRHPALASSRLSRHPNCDALTRLEASGGANQPATINDMQWHELPRLEAAAGMKPSSPPRTRTGHAYFRKRARVALRDEWRRLLGDMPSLWRVLVELAPENVEELAILLGLEMLAHAAQGQPPKPVNEMLQPLDEPHERQVVTRMKELEGKALPRAITAPWEESYRKAMTKRTGVKLLRSLALNLLSQLQSARLDERTRLAAQRHCRSDLFQVLELGRKSSQPLAASQLPQIENMVLETLGRLRPVKAPMVPAPKAKKK